MQRWDVAIIGAGAAGMFCAIEAGRRGRRIVVLDHAKAPGEKIRISGGGRCNFTNIHTHPERFLSQNPKFCVSALSRYTAQDFTALVQRHNIGYHEKTLGQLFCDQSAKQIIDMLVFEMKQAGCELRLGVDVTRIERGSDGFTLTGSFGQIATQSLVIATGGKSIPKMGASAFGYGVAEQFGLRLTETRPGLVPLTFSGAELEGLRALSGVSVEGRIRCGKNGFEEALLFTHRGLSGPAVLQISSYWREGQGITVDLASSEMLENLRRTRSTAGRLAVRTALSHHLPKRLAGHMAERMRLEGNIGDFSDKRLRAVVDGLQNWHLMPSGSEGYRTAEVTLGGVDTRDLNSQTMAARADPSLFFIGEVVDVTGWLGGYNFQWAWSSGWVAGQVA